MYVIKTPYLQKYVCYNTTIFRDKHDGVITVIEPDIQECEVKWASENIITNKVSGGDGIPAKLFQIL